MTNEDQLLWSVFLNKAISGGEEVYFERAFQHCKTDVIIDALFVVLHL